MAEDNGRRPRVKSAHARLLSSPSDNLGDYTRSRRAQSAKLLKKQHEASGFVFPRPGSRPSREQTMYSTQFCRKDMAPATLRPTSATRRNNPHPSSTFMTWKMPTKVFEHPRAVVPSEDTRTDLKERFYDDYMGERNDGDARNEVLTQLAKVPFPGASLSETRAFQEMERQSGEVYRVTGRTMELGTRKPSKSQSSKLDAQELLGRSIKDGASPALKNWLENASEEERQVVLNMLKSAETDEERVQTLLLGVLKPDMMSGVQTWLKTAGESDKRVVLKLLQSVQGVKELTKDAMTHRPSSRQGRLLGHRQTFYSRHAAPATYPQVDVSELPRYRGDDYNRWVYGVETGKNTTEYRTGEKDGNPFVLWHHRTKRNPTPGAYHRGAIFSTPQKPIGQHFAIIPEWPIA